MKVAVIIYHSNASKIYKKEWIDKCINSIKAQTFQNFDVFELNYGDGYNNTEYFFEGVGVNYIPMGLRLNNHTFAMNHLISHCLVNNYDIILNTNLDDYYSPDRFQKQIDAINNGAQLVSSNFHYFSDERGIFKRMDMSRYGNIGIQLRRGHNIIAHPVVAYHKSFFDDGLRYNDLLGKEDLDLWQRADKLGRRMVILNDYLLQYRIHDNQITKTHKG